MFNNINAIVTRFVNWLSSLIDVDTLNQRYQGSNQPVVSQDVNQHVADLLAQRFHIAGEHGVSRVYVYDYELPVYRFHAVKTLMWEQHNLNLRLRADGIEVFRGDYV